MEIRLFNLRIRNFKGLKNQNIAFNGEDMDIIAENGVGKTSVYDAFLWLLFAKDSEGRTDFNYRPLDAEGNAMKGLVVEVQADLTIDGVKHTYTRQNIERIVKKEIRGFSTQCYIDEVEYPPTKFTKAIADVIDETKFRCLTDLAYFNEKIAWTERRITLLAFAGKLEKPKGFETLIIAMDGRDMNDFKGVLKTRKKNCEKEQKEISPRIDEIQRGHEDYAETLTVETLINQRKEKEQIVATLDVKRKEYVESEDERKAEKDHIEELVEKRHNRRIEFERESSSIKPYLDEKESISKTVYDMTEAADKIKRDMQAKAGEFNVLECEGVALNKKLSDVRGEYSLASKTVDPATCYACFQPLPADKVAVAKAQRMQRMEKLAKTGNALLADVEANKAKQDQIEKDIKRIEVLYVQAMKDLDVYMGFKKNRFAEIDALIEQRPIGDPTNDPEWLKLTADIDEARESIGLPLVDQIRALDDKRAMVKEDINRISEKLVKYDRAKQDRQRIAELEAREKELAQQVAEIEQLLTDIEQYRMQEGKLIEEAVNKKFKYTQFRLFTYDLDGGINECCEATYHGTPYGSLSTGERKYIGFDVVNVLAEYYGINVTIFVDHAESITMPLITESQMIRLIAAPDVSELTFKGTAKKTAKKTTKKTKK